MALKIKSISLKLKSIIVYKHPTLLKNWNDWADQISLFGGNVYGPDPNKISRSEAIEFVPVMKDAYNIGIYWCSFYMQDMLRRAENVVD